MQHPRRGDEVMASFCGAILLDMLRHDQYWTLFEEQISMRNLPPALAVELHWKAAQEIQMKTYPANGYPVSHYEAQAWLPTVELMSDPTEPETYDRVKWVICNDYNHANKPNRNRGILLASSILERIGRLGEQITVCEVGGSLGLNLKGYAMRAVPEPLKQGKIEIVDRTTKRPLTHETILWNFIMRTAPLLKNGVSIDSTPITEDAVSLALASSFDGIQLEDYGAYESLVTLVESTFDNVHFITQDFLDPDYPVIVEANNGEKFDIVTFFTVLYQHDHAAISKLLENARKILKPDGIILIQDIVNPYGYSRSGLRRNSRGYQEEYKYRLLIAEHGGSNWGFSELFVWEDGSCNRGYVGKDIKSLVGSVALLDAS